MDDSFESARRRLNLLALLETAQQVLQAEQQARRELETKLLLPAPGPVRTSNAQVWVLVGLLAVVVAFAGWHWRDRIVAALAP